MNKKKVYGIGVLLTLVGGSGLAQIQMDADGCFWLFAVLFSVGLAICIGSFENEL